MIFHELFKIEKLWWKKATLVESFHIVRILQDKSWKLGDTAKEIRMSMGFVSEELTLARALKDNPKLKELSRNKALKKIRS